MAYEAHNSARQVIATMLQARRIAVVGLSDDPSRTSYRIATYLRGAGREIVPVNPMSPAVMGMKSYAVLSDVPGKIDLVNVFRRAEFCPDVVRAAIEAGVAGVWLQSGIRSDRAKELADAAGMPFVQDRCIMVEMEMAG